MTEESAAARFQRQREWFHRLLDLPADACAEALDQLQADDPVMAEELRRLLSHASAETRQDQAAEASAPAAGRLEADTDIAGRYRILSPLGVGGMGEVYLAQRNDDTAQRVAIKLIRNDAIGNADRFVRERRILARLQHPNIAHLIDAGVSADGRPWFALELVEGERITNWCDARRLDLRERVRLFLRVCDAVRYAHANLVLHRDIKPSNVLVATTGEPKLLDFGIAKPIDDTGPDAASHTQTMAFTPAYAAPEQLRGEPVTTASDVFQLGLVFFELCTGVQARTPGSPNDTTVPRPDSAITRRDTQTGETLAQRRATSRERLIRMLRGDLGRIVARSVADDPAERYASASELADDLQRWLADEPVRAHRASAGYRLRKFLRRNRVAAAAAALALMALLAGTAGIAWQYSQARMHAEQANQIKDFLLELFNEADPDASEGEQLTVREVLDRGAARLEHGQIAAPLRLEFSGVLADLYRRLGLYEQSQTLAQSRLTQLDQIAAPAHERHAANLALAHIFLDASNQPDADTLLTTLEADGSFPPHGPHRTELLALRGRWQHQQGDYTAARNTLETALEQKQAGNDPVAVARAQVRLAATLTNIDELDSAQSLLETATDTLQKALGENHSEVAKALEELSSVHFYQDNLDASLATIERAVAIHTRLFGESHPSTLMSQTQQAAVLRILGRMEESHDQLDEIIPQLEARSGTKAIHDLAEALTQRGITLMRMGRRTESQADLIRAIDIYDQQGARSAPTHAMAYLSMAFLHLANNDRPAAQQAVEKSRDIVQSSHGIGAARTLNALSQVEQLAERPDPAVAERQVRDALEKATEQFGPDHYSVAILEISLGALLYRNDDYDNAIELLDRGLATMMKRPREQNLLDVVFIIGIRSRAQSSLEYHQQLPPPEIMDYLPDVTAAAQESGMIVTPMKAGIALTLAETMAMMQRREESRAALDTARALLGDVSQDEAMLMRQHILRIENLLP